MSSAKRYCNPDDSGAVLCDVGVDQRFWDGRRVLVTGHTGFKGAWLTLWLSQMGAAVRGIANAVPTKPSLFELCGLSHDVDDVRADVRDPDAVLRAFDGEPEVVFHLAAQPFVRRSFTDPRATYETNVMGTVNVLEAVRATPSVRIVVNVTSDKCYDNRDEGRPFRESDAKGGHDPYSSSKGCAELVADAYLRSYFGPHPEGPRLASARAGNVIGGGDWGEDRLIPDLMRGALVGERVPIRNPDAVRPWQHVLNPLSGYLELAQTLASSPAYQGGWNFGPPADDVRSALWLAEQLNKRCGGRLRWSIDRSPQPHEAQYLALDSGQARERLGWLPRWDLPAALTAVADWYAAFRDGGDSRQVTLAQIESFVAAGRTVAA